MAGFSLAPPSSVARPNTSDETLNKLVCWVSVFNIAKSRLTLHEKCNEIASVIKWCYMKLL